MLWGKPKRKMQQAPPAGIIPAVAPLPAEQIDLIQLIREARHKPVQRTVYPRGGAEALVAYMQAEGFDGWYTVPEIDAWWEACREINDWRPLPIEMLREALRCIPRVIHRRTRLLAPEYAEVLARMQRVARMKGEALPPGPRATLFFIPPPGALAETGQSPSLPDAPPVVARAPRPATGRRPAKSHPRPGQPPAVPNNQYVDMAERQRRAA